MKTSIIVVLFFCFLPVHLFAQDDNKPVKDELSLNEFKKFLKREYYFLANPGSNEVLSNFASLDTKDGQVNFAGTFFIGDKPEPLKSFILSFNAKGSGNKDAFPIYSGNEFTSNVGLGLQLKIPLYGKDTFLEYSNDEKLTRDIRIRELETELKTMEIRSNSKIHSFELLKEINESKKNILNAEKKVSETSQKIKRICHQINDLNDGSGINKSKTDSLKREKAIALFTVENLRIQMRQDSVKIAETENKMANLPNYEDALWLYRQENIAERKEAKEAIQMLGHSINWLAFNYELENTVFKYFIPQNSLENQIKNEGFLSHTFSFQYSKSVIRMDSLSYYYTFGGAIAIDDNYNTLTPIEIVERTNYGTNPDDRYAVNKTSALSGQYDTGLYSYKMFTDFYVFLLDNNQAAIHTRLEAQTKKSFNDQFNLEIGFLFNFTDKDDKKSRINAEVYYELDDVTNSNESEDSILERSVFGLRFSVPFLIKANN